MNKLFFKIVLSLGLLAALLLNMDVDALKNASHLVKASAWGYALVFIIAQLLLLSLRWMYLVNVGRYRMNYAEALEITVASLVANLVFVTTISGIVVRVAMAIQYGASLFKSIFATAIDRLMTLAALLLLTTIFLPSLALYVDLPLHKNISMLIGALMLVMFVFTPMITLAIVRKLPNFSLSQANIRSGIRYLQLLLNNNVLLGKILSVSLLAQLCFFLAVYHIAISAGVSLSFLQIMIVLPAIAIISSMPFSFGGWGLREGAFVYGLGILGVPMETAFSISVQIGLVSLVATVLAGIPTLITSNSPFRQAQKIAVKREDS
ncbi:MAG TPA: lysylphosphatidylglycerol synthase transmembrane domain-containing protein [Alphaproteobacteria bacterium]|nr:lysylphosphatidylglycerol synthase transmembrane domain-containing protein [Alphaproteobacteria bacterium]